MTERLDTRRSLVGRTLASRYEIRALIGRGGMGEVYEAADRLLDRTVAVKVLRPELAADRRFLARFRREARTSARLGHHGIVAVHDISEAEGLVFIVMELVAGRTFGEIVRRTGRLDPVRAALLTARAAEALAHAHDRGVVHRDVSPGNLMLTRGGVVKVLDFGLARAARGSSRSGSDGARGTVAYIAPEQLDGGGDQRVDVYSLGAVLFELLTGRAPFEADSTAELVDAVRRGRPPRVSDHHAVPPALDDIVARAMARDPSDRYPTSDRLARALRASVADAATEPTSAASVRDGSAPLTVPLPPPQITERLPTPDTTASSAAPAARRRSKRALAKTMAWLSAAAVAAGALLIAVPSLAGIGDPITATLTGPDPLPAPSGVVASATCDGWLSTGVDVVWTPGGPSDGYELYRRGTTGTEFELVAVLDDWRSTTYRDTDLGVDASYEYRLRAVDGQRVSGFTPTTVAATPLLCLT